MPVIPREKGEFVQPGTPQIIPRIAGSFLSVDGFVDFDSLLLQEDYPVLFALLGTTYNEPTDNDSTEFRTPKTGDWELPEPIGGNHKWMIRF